MNSHMNPELLRKDRIIYESSEEFDFVGFFFFVFLFEQFPISWFSIQTNVTQHMRLKQLTWMLTSHDKSWTFVFRMMWLDKVSISTSDQSICWTITTITRVPRTTCLCINNIWWFDLRLVHTVETTRWRLWRERTFFIISFFPIAVTPQEQIDIRILSSVQLIATLLPRKKKKQKKTIILPGIYLLCVCVFAVTSWVNLTAVLICSQSAQRQQKSSLWLKKLSRQPLAYRTLSLDKITHLSLSPPPPSALISTTDAASFPFLLSYVHNSAYYGWHGVCMGGG